MCRKEKEKGRERARKKQEAKVRLCEQGKRKRATEESNYKEIGMNVYNKYII